MLRNYRSYCRVKPKQQKKRKNGGVGKCLLLPGTLLLLWMGARLVGGIVDARVKPTLYALADYEAEYAAVQAIRSASAKEMTDHTALYQNFYRITYQQDGKMQSITGDATALNRAKLSLTQAVQSAMEAMPAIRREVDYGNLSGSSLYSHWGPHWVLEIKPRGYAAGKLQETVKSMGVNQTEYRIELVLTVTMDLILDSNRSALPVSDTVLLASAVVSGDTPAVYSQTID